jgi:hypothetical protein
VDASKATPASASSTASTSSPSTIGLWRTKLTSFFVGVGFTTFWCYYRLREDLWASSTELASQIGDTGKNVSSLLDKVKVLENRLNQLENTAKAAAVETKESSTAADATKTA